MCNSTYLFSYETTKDKSLNKTLKKLFVDNKQLGISQYDSKANIKSRSNEMDRFYLAHNDQFVLLSKIKLFFDCTSKEVEI